MMSWSEIKSAINSTLGTSSFLSIDKMIENAKIFIANYISNEIAGVKVNINNMLTSTTGVGKAFRTQTLGASEIIHENSGFVCDKFIAPVSGVYQVTVEVNTKQETGGSSFPDYVIYNIPPKTNSIITSINTTDLIGGGSSYDATYLTLNGANAYTYSGIGYSVDTTNLVNCSTWIGQHITNVNYDSPVNGDVRYSTGYLYATAGDTVLIYAKYVGSRYTYLNSVKTTITYGQS